MRVALVHDYLNEFGGAERVLEALSELYPDAPIYTAFYVKGSRTYKRFKNKKIVTSWGQHVPFFARFLHSPLRFLAPFIWRSFDFSAFDVVIGSSGWYVTKGFKKGPRGIEICYCHSPPRWLYGYETAIKWQKFFPIRIYGKIVGAFMRMYDKEAADLVDFFIANSKETQRRIKTFYDRDSVVIYPPVELDKRTDKLTNKKKDYYLVVSRIVGSKGIELAIKAAQKQKLELKIVGEASWYGKAENGKWAQGGDTVEFLGFVPDEKLGEVYRNAKAFLALAKDEDFGITPVEAMAYGTPVIAYYGGGYKETVIEGKTGVFFHEATIESLSDAIIRFEKLKLKAADCVAQAKKFSKDRFQKEIKEFVDEHVKAQTDQVPNNKKKEESKPGAIRVLKLPN